MPAVGAEQIWANWVALQEIGPEHRTGRLLAFYAGRHHVAFDLDAGVITDVQVSDRDLRIEQVLVRLELVTPRDLREGLHRLAQQDDVTAVVPLLLNQGAINLESLAIARERQMVQILRTLLTAEHLTLTFTDQPSSSVIETVIRIEAALASAYAEEPVLQARSASDRPHGTREPPSEPDRPSRTSPRSSGHRHQSM